MENRDNSPERSIMRYYIIKAELIKKKDEGSVLKKVKGIRSSFNLDMGELYIDTNRKICIEISGEKAFRFDEKLADEVAKFAEGDIYVTTNSVDRRNVYMITDDMNDMIRKYMYTLAGGKAVKVNGSMVTYYHGRADILGLELKDILNADEQHKLAMILLGRSSEEKPIC